MVLIAAEHLVRTATHARILGLCALTRRRAHTRFTLATANTLTAHHRGRNWFLRTTRYSSSPHYRNLGSLACAFLLARIGDMPI